ncbi:MAG: 3D domain-containing protein [Eubacteriales bacterium]|mgnify:FL=1|nr:3D domain-containing protein [Eubacteriales bacterium]
MQELWTILEITAYTAGYESCQKHPDDPLYGITYSGARAQQGRTVAAGPDIPIGTRIFIPDLSAMPNGGIFIVEDRGGAISNAHLDIYMESLWAARNWGRQHLEALMWLAGDVKEILAKIDSDRRWRWRDREALARLFP